MSDRVKVLLKENNELEKQIRKEENQAVLTDLVVYIRSANISPYYQEKVRRDIWQMIADGEKRDKTVRDIIGDDYKLSCDSVIAELPKLSRGEYMVSLVRDILLSLDVLLLIWFAFEWVGQIVEGFTLPYFNVTAGNIICAVLCIVGAFLVFRMISRNTFGGNEHVDKKSFILLFVILSVCMCANTFVRYRLFEIHVLVVMFVMVALFAAYKLLDAKID